MRDVFGILAIGLAVVALGVFRVPDENALVAAGIRAEAESALYQTRHPVSVSVKGRVITAEGRVESEEDGQRIIAILEALDGVEEVQGQFEVLPTVTPFVLVFEKGAEGLGVQGHVPDRALNEALGSVLGAPPDLPLAVGAPDRDWGQVALAGAGALGRMLDGTVRLEDRLLTLSGRVHLPGTLQQISAEMAALPDGYEVRLQIEALDDGLPYALLASRDARMGLRLSGKLPPDFDMTSLDSLGLAQHSALALAPLPLDAPGFSDALNAALPLMQALPEGALSVAPGLVSLQGGPVPDAVIAQARALRAALPEGYALHLALIPEDDTGPLALSVTWDGTALALDGTVPADFDAEALSQRFGAPLGPVTLARSPYPDLEGWAARVEPALAALRQLQSGTATLDAQGVRVGGVAADPAARQAAKIASGGLDLGAVQLADDGAPSVFTLEYDATKGGSLSGKFPQGLDPQQLADALGLPNLRGAPRVGPDGDGSGALRALEALRPWMPEIERVTLRYDQGALALEIAAAAGVDPEALRRQLLPALPGGTRLDLLQAEAALQGTRRSHAFLGIPQVFSDGYWLPVLGFSPSADSCAAQVRSVAPVPFAEAGFTPALGASQPLAHLAAVARSCTQFAGLTLVIEAEAASAGAEVLNRQLSRRRAEALREALIARGIDAGRIEATGLGAGPGDLIRYRWQ